MKRDYEGRKSVVYGPPGEYELDPGKIIGRLLDIQDRVFKLYKNMDRSNQLVGHKSGFTQIEYEIIEVIEDIRYAQKIGVGDFDEFDEPR